MDTADRRFSPEARLRYARTLVWPVLPLAAAAWWVVGALPWIVDGLGSSSPRYWVADAVTGEASGGYITLLPFRAVFLPLLVALTLVGGAAAGITVRWTSRDARRPVLAGFASAVGALAAMAYTVAQSAGATRQLGSDFDRDDRVLIGVVAVAVAGGLLGLVLGWCLAYARPGAAALASAPVAVAAGAWTTRLVVVGLGPDDAGSVVQWTSAATVGLVVGIGLARVGAAPARRLWAWVAVTVVVAVAQAAFSAFEHLAGSLHTGTGLPSALRGLAGESRGIFVDALAPAHQSWWWLVVAVGVALAGAPLTRRARRVRRVGAASTPRATVPAPAPTPATASTAATGDPVPAERTTR
ncbi:hypothetical protein [Intrasporangium sp. YIM S08009]|uniref:hypothetical protein n=1 Tax=Intrasporangium zincisolvens TaxID=3080018 RepID=UPI002B055D19|nr:hypothetical protein [Intrasporangium sp. YIM S08009]